MNWAGLAGGPVEKLHTPRSLGDIVRIIQDAEAAGKSVRAVGRTWAFEAIAYSPEVMVSLRELKAVLTYVTDPGTGALLSDKLSNNRTLVHVEAGISIAELNDALDSRGLAMPTLGGANGQTLVGALSTSTHGGDFVEPPFCDLVHAVHLVGPGGQEYWIERESMPITSSRRLGRVLPCRDTLIVRDDEFFDAVVVSLGRFGIIYSVVVETVPAYTLARSETTVQRSQVIALLKQGINDGSILEPLLASLPDPPPELNVSTRRPRAMELVIDSRNPSYVHVLRRWLATGPAMNVDFRDNPLCVLGTTKILELGIAGLNTLKSVAPLTAVVVPKIAELRAARNRNLTPGQAMALVTNAYWSSGIGMVLDLVALGIYHFQFPLQRGPSHILMTGDPAFAESTCYRANSCEIVFDAANILYIALVEVLATSAPSYNQAGYISLRYQKGSRALLSMHGGGSPQTVSIEVSTLQGLSGAASWIEMTMATAFGVGGHLHWGQQNNHGQAQLQALYGSRLDRWRAVLGGFSGSSTLFSNPFTITRGLEPQGWRPINIEGRAGQIATGGVQSAVSLLLDARKASPPRRPAGSVEAALFLLLDFEKSTPPAKPSVRDGSQAAMLLLL